MSPDAVGLGGRVSAARVSPILAASARAAALRSQGRDIVDLTTGEPDFATPAHVIEAAIASMRRGETRYPNLTGTAELKIAIQGKYERENALRFSHSEIIVCNGAKQVIFNALMATLEPGDEVVLAAPYWTSYPDMVSFAGGVAVPVSTNAGGGWKITPEGLDAAIGPRTRWLLLNSPSNPTGAVYGDAELKALAAVLERHPGVAILSDDIYEHIRFTDRPFATMAASAPQLAGRCLTVNGVSKAYAMTGWRLGFGAGPASLVSGMAVVQSQATSGACSISQAAAAAALSGDQGFVAAAAAAYRRRRDIAVAAVRDMPGVSGSIPEGAFYLLLDFRECPRATGRDVHDDQAFTQLLLDEHDLAVVPGSAFGAPGHVRISIATSDAELARGLERLGEASRR